jgi:hypothetical protein
MTLSDVFRCLWCGSMTQPRPLTKCDQCEREYALRREQAEARCKDFGRCGARFQNNQKRRGGSDGL